MNAWMRRGLATCALAAAGSALALACGPDFISLITMSHSMPTDTAAYGRGELGVVKPTYARRYLVQAYRTLDGLPALPAGAAPT